MAKIEDLRKIQSFIPIDLFDWALKNADQKCAEDFMASLDTALEAFKQEQAQSVKNEIYAKAELLPADDSLKSAIDEEKNK